MPKYSITTPEKLEWACDVNSWLKNCTPEQRQKVLKANEEGVHLEQISSMIWFCSNVGIVTLNEIRIMLRYLQMEYEQECKEEENVK